jgi:hypothetical protein
VDIFSNILMVVLAIPLVHIPHGEGGMRLADLSQYVDRRIRYTLSSDRLDLLGPFSSRKDVL